MDFSPEVVRARFHELTAVREQVDAVLQPLRDELNMLVAGDTDLSVREAQEREAEVRAQIIELQNQLAPTEMERAACARFLNGKTGLPE